ncbi:MAG: hypothetical protein RLZZ366_1344 [Pseudomonadota bacterium]|jgi:hypothetical protein
MESARLLTLETKHAALDRRIANESQRPLPDSGLVAQLKKQKLKIKEALQPH